MTVGARIVLAVASLAALVLCVVWGAKTLFTPREHPHLRRNRVLTPPHG